MSQYELLSQLALSGTYRGESSVCCLDKEIVGICAIDHIDGIGHNLGRNNREYVVFLVPSLYRLSWRDTCCSVVD